MQDEETARSENVGRDRGSTTCLPNVALLLETRGLFHCSGIVEYIR